MSEDLIKRSDAIKAVNKAKAEGMVECPTYYIGLIPYADRPQLDKDLVEPIGNGNVIMSEDTYEELLVDRAQGKWIYQFRDSENEEYRCSECGYPQVVKANFCPNCGARMKGADDE